jgi:rubrerythrin
MDYLEYRDFVVKGFVAFILPFAWSVIVYPILKSHKKSWIALVILATLLSLAVLIIKELLDILPGQGRLPLYDVVITYVFGIILSAALLSGLFYKKTRQLSEQLRDEPADRHDVRRGMPLPKRIHLRQLLQIAVLVEEQGQSFYEQLAANTPDTQVRRLSLRLAGDEQRHRNIFRKSLDQWLPLPLKGDTLVEITKYFEAQGLFALPPGGARTAEALLRFAIAQEHAAVEFYRAIEKSFPQTWKRLAVMRIIVEERAHAAVLEELMRKLPSAE